MGEQAQNFVNQAAAVLEGEQPWCRWLDVLVDLPLSMLENLPQVAKFLVANQLYRCLGAWRMNFGFKTSGDRLVIKHGKGTSMIYSFGIFQEI